MEGYAPNIIETHSPRVRLVIDRFHYPVNAIFEGLHQVNLSSNCFGRVEDRYVDRTHMYIGEQSLHEDDESGVSLVDVFEGLEDWLLLSLILQWRFMLHVEICILFHPRMYKRRITRFSPHN